MFGRAAITLSIGPHSSCRCFTCRRACKLLLGRPIVVAFVGVAGIFHRGILSDSSIVKVNIVTCRASINVVDGLDAATTEHKVH